jgi:hypothetical protein
MGPPRNFHILTELTRLPWWASVVSAGVVYVAMKWLALPVAESSPVLNPIARALSGLAGWFAILFLLPIPFSLITYRWSPVLQGALDGAPV